MMLNLTQTRLQKLERLAWILLCNEFNLRSIISLQTLENADEHFADDIDHFMVMVSERKLQIEPNKFSEMAMSVGIFRSEHWSHSEDALEISRYAHLFVQLRRLREVSVAFEVGHCEDIGPAFTSSRDDLRSVYLRESFGGQMVAEQPAHASLHTKYGLVDWSSQIDDPVI